MEEITEYNSAEDLKGLKGLPGLNSKSSDVNDEFSQENFNKRLQRTNNFSSLVRSNKSSEMFTPTKEKESIGNLIPDYSKYDTEIQTMADVENISDFRGKVQSWYDQIGAGTAKMGITAATTFANSTAGLVWGVGAAINQGKWSGLWNNSFMDATSKISEASEEIFKNHYTDFEKNAAWYDNIFTANFLGDKILKNVGFTIGAIGAGAITGGLVNPFLSGIGKAGSILNKVSLGAGRLLSTAVSSMGEASIEAYNSAKDYGEGSMTNINAYYGEKEQSLKSKYAPRLQAILDNPSNLVPDKETGISKRDQLIESLQNEYGSEVNNINLEKKRATDEVENNKLNVGNNVFLANQAILGVSNNLQFGRLLSGGFNNAKRAKSIITKVASTGEDLLPGARNASTALAKGEIKGEAKKGFTKAVIGKTLGNGLSEGLEESAQNIASNTNRIMYSARLNNFTGAKINPDVTAEMANGINAMGVTLKEQFGSFSAPGWEEFFLGFTTGIGGVISVKRVANDKGGTSFRPDWAGGAVEAYREAKEEYKGADMVDAINSTLQDPKFVERTKALARHNSYQNLMDQALENNDKFEYKNSEISQLYGDAIMFRDAGLIDLYNEFLDGFSEIDSSEVEDIKSIVAIPNSDHSIYDGLSNEEIVTDIKEKSKKTKQRVKDFLSVYDNIEVNYGDKLTKDETEQFAWTVATTQDLDNRARESFEKAKPMFDKQLEAYQTIKYINYSAKEYAIGKKQLTIPEIFNNPYLLFTSLNLNEELAKDVQDILEYQGADINYQDTEALPELLIDIAKMTFYRADLISKANSYRQDINTLKEEVTGTIAAAEALTVEDANTNLNTSLEEASSVAEVRKVIDFANKNSEVSKVLSENENPFVQSYRDLQEYQQSANNLLVESNELGGKSLTEEDKIALNELLNKQISRAEDVKSLKELELPNIDELDVEDFNRAKEIHDMYLDLLNNIKVTVEDNKVKLDALNLANAVGEISKDSEVGHKKILPIVNTKSNTNETTEELVIENPYNGAIYELKEVGGKLVEFDKAVPSFTDVYNYIKSKGAFEYINLGKLKIGDTLFFVKDPSYVEPDPSYNTIFIVTKDKNGNTQILNVLKANDSTKKLREKITKEYNNRATKEGVFIASPTTKVRSLRAGSLIYLDHLDNRKLNKDSNPILVIKGREDTIYGKVFGTIVNRDKMLPGVVYFLSPTIEGTYIASAVTTKKVTKELLSNSSNLVKDFKNALTTLVSNSISTSTISIEDIENLSKYIDTSRLNFQISNNRKTFIFTGYEKSDKGEFIMEVRDGVARRKELPKKVYKSVETSIEDIINSMLSALVTYDVAIQVDADRLEDKDYVDNLIDNEVVTINLDNNIVRNNSFIMEPVQFNITIETPVEAISESNRVEVITDNEVTYFIENGIVLNTNSIPIEDGDIIELVKDLAIIDNFIGTTDLVNNYYNGNYITPNGKVLNKYNRNYLSEEDSIKAKATINRVKATNEVTNKIQKDQSNVSLNREDKSNFYISIKGITEKFTNIDMLSTSSLASYVNILSNVISSRSNIESFNTMLDTLSNKVGAEGILDSFKVTKISDINSNSDTLAREISITLGSLDTTDNSLRELVIGYFSDKENFSKPANMEEKVFKSLVSTLNNIDNTLHIKGEQIVGSPVVYSNREGSKYASKIDILTKNSNGRVSIYKVVVTDTNLVLDNKTSKDILSKARVELSARKTILENVNKLPIDKIYILPISTIKDSNNKITSFKGQNSIELEPNTSATKLVFPIIKEEKVEKVEPKLPRFNKTSKKNEANFSLEYLFSTTNYNFKDNNNNESKALLQMLLNKKLTKEVRVGKINVYLNVSKGELFRELNLLGIDRRAIGFEGPHDNIKINPEYLINNLKFKNKQNSKDILFRLLDKFRNLPIQSVGTYELESLKLPKNTKAFNKGGKIYIVEHKATATDIAEEVLHIFTNDIFETNSPLANELYLEALREFQYMVIGINSTYTNKEGFNDLDRQKELVTKALLRYIEAEFTNVPTTFKDALTKIAKEIYEFIIEGFSSVILGNNRIIFTDSIQNTATLKGLATILNTKNTFFIKGEEFEDIKSTPSINNIVSKNIQKMFTDNLIVKEKNSTFDTQNKDTKSRLADNNMTELELDFGPEEIQKQKLKCL